MLIELSTLLLLSTLFVSMLAGCKKTNNASKLKPKDMGKGTTPMKAPANGGSSKEPVPGPPMPELTSEPKLAERPADDNETINDAKSNWGTVS
ncbi:hypothetical protein GCK72_016851 [Caenorhabditis remanei]|uniref:Uncharacterized protein n=2 Tax=Caenorhabditis remanei TaxID=31234 RepID=E3NAZ2_CAERE|nr:hypothetical protein GCK72_016851 [Caenorhabditis remanei]EFO91718.1 hypothetical protein CRE_06092 [Caenorhabditis remanei]KAF1750303.1 hypothetical protein GCK72_016851 [Caenorhabditis remanei]